MDLFFLILLIGLFSSLISGMVGIGGSIINYPLLLQTPPLFGFPSFTIHEITTIGSIHVLFTSLLATLTYRKENMIHKPLVIYMGSIIVFASFLGGFGSQYMTDDIINAIYILLTLIAIALMFLSASKKEPSVEISFNRKKAGILALIIGALSGIIGAAGAFIIVPALIALLKIPTRTAIASSIVITLISSLGSVIGRLNSDHILMIPTFALIIASLLATPLGAKLSKFIPVKILKNALTLLLIISILKMSLSI